MSRPRLTSLFLSCRTFYTHQSVAPFLVAVTFVFIPYANNTQRLNLSNLVIPLLLVIIATLIGLWCLKKIFKGNIYKARVAVSCFWIAFFSYGPVASILVRRPIILLNVDVSQDKPLFAIFLLCLLMAFLFLYRTTSAQTIDKIFLASFSGLLILQLSIIVWSGELIAKSTFVGSASTTQRATSDTQARPDIYYIILDKYAADTTLQEYGYDNSSFTNYLDQTGFYVASKSLTNYPKTSLSIASSMNLNYLDAFKPAGADSLSEVSNVLPLLQNAAAANFLKKIGYHYFHLGSWYIPTSSSSIATKNYNYVDGQLQLDRFQTLLLQQSMLAPVIGQFFNILPEDQARASFEYQRRIFPEIVAEPGPKFVFAHILMPHDPFIYDSQCQLRSTADVASQTRMYNYLQHIGCANQQAKRMIDEIQTKDPGSIILLQADEGPMALKHPLPRDDDYSLGRDMPVDSRLERTRILNAYYFPDGDYAELNQEVTPVNSFRLLFNKYFDTKYDILPNKTFLFQDHDHIFNMYDGTKELRIANTDASTE